MTEWLLRARRLSPSRAGTALFVAAEFSLVALDRPTVQQAVDNGESGGQPVLRSLRSSPPSCRPPRSGSR